MPRPSPHTSDRLVSSRCPECGAPVDFRSVPRDQAQVKCRYCGTLITMPARAQPLPSQLTAKVFVTSERSMSKRGPGGGAQARMMILVLLIVAVIITGMGLWLSTW